MTIMHSA